MKGISAFMCSRTVSRITGRGLEKCVATSEGDVSVILLQ